MNIIFITHPSFVNFHSISRFASILAKGMAERGHNVEIWSPKSQFFSLPVPESYKKWFGYIDQFITFPNEIKKRFGDYPSNTLYVVTDNALGPWIPLVSNRPHVIHCHDFLAQYSALNMVHENPLSWTGKWYQKFIRRGLRKGTNFISVSEKTKQDLHKFLSKKPAYSEVVHNGLNPHNSVHSVDEARILFSKETGLDLTNGYLLHVGGNQWYKNRLGVIAIYDALRLTTNYSLPLIMIGDKPGSALLAKKELSFFKADIHCLTGIEDQSVHFAYTGASVFIFPSLAEGFGWPIAEAMAAGCPVVTTNEAPMTEVGGEAAFYIPRQPATCSDTTQWAIEASAVVSKILNFSSKQREEISAAGLIHVKKFNMELYLDKIEKVYKHLSENTKIR